MYFTSLSLLSFLALSVVGQELPQGVLGFNSGATKADSKAKVESDFEDEFKTAQGLRGSPGLFNSVRLYTMVQAGTTNNPISAFPAALKTNTSMLLGIGRFADLVVAISVGSEDMYRLSESGVANNAGLGQGPDTIVRFIREIGTDVYTYYEADRGNGFSNTTAVFDDIYNQTFTFAGNKPVWVTETGYPVSGPNSGEAIASVSIAAQYWQLIGCDRLFGRVNTWWYNIRDSNPAITEKFGITENLKTTARFNLTCAADSGAPAPVNVGSGAASSHGGEVLLAVSMAFIGLSFTL
ncbi:hypothetical protein BN1708_012256 [Verticillium longisporum]|uniref:Glycoside hydrolase family 17 protein n=1 Tax=Verticillium longisporum TaxID=100787 RepID=A0A0G4L840_VERLO|nr:hypothetical protein BN1708_012256 [Verticillium longisporum]